MEEVLLDTDALIEIHSRPEVIPAILAEYRCLISQVTLYEYLFGLIYIGRDLEGEKKALEQAYEVIPLSQPILKRALRIDLELTKRGERLEFRDLVVGATAIELATRLVTGNLKHFERMSEFGLSILPLDELIREVERPGRRESEDQI